MTLKPEAGKRYKLRNGMVTQPLEWDGDEFFTKGMLDGFLPMWLPSERSSFFNGGGDESTKYDIVEEYTK